MKPLRISIIGGSLAGLFAGVLLKRDGHDVRVHERSRQGLAGRGAGLVPQREVFQILRAIDQAGEIVQTIREAQTQLSWDVLYEQVAERIAPADYRLGSQLVRVEAQGDGPATLSFADGSREEVDLLIGADGIGSVVRQALSPDHAANRYAGYVAWRGLIPEMALPARASLLLDRFAFYLAPGDHALGYLVPGPNGETTPGKRRYNWVWYRRVAEHDLRALFTDRDAVPIRSRCRAAGCQRSGATRCAMMPASTCRRPSRLPSRRRRRPRSRGSTTTRRPPWWEGVSL